MRLILTIAGGLAFPLLAACNMSAAKMAASQKAEHRVASLREVVVASKIVNRQELWEWESTTLKDVRSLVAIQRLGADESLVLDDRGTLYRTTDGGETWGDVSIPSPGAGDDAHLYNVTSFYFVNPSVGWATVVRTPEDVLDVRGFESWMLRTTDGGATWGVQYSDTAAQLTRVVFANEREGWAAGGRLVKGETQHFEPLLMHTTDQGSYWADVSSDIGAHSAGGFLNDIYAGGPSQALLADSNDKFLSTDTGGQSWKEVWKLTKLEPQVSIRKLGVRAGGRTWALGGTGGREGTWTVLALQRDDDSWTVYKSLKVFLTDAAFLSDMEVIACGFIKTDATPLFDGGGADGVILHSPDAGRNWSVVYRNSQVKAVSALSVVNENNIWAVGNDGLVLRLKARQNL